MNWNELAQIIANREGLKVELPIGQIKEVLRIIRGLIVTHTLELMKLFFK